jgi:hypothetical protein
MESKKPIIPIQNYFDNPNDQQTPSNTPNNKKLGGGCLNFDMDKMDFSRNKHKYSDDEDDDENQTKKIENNVTNKIIGGGLNFDINKMDFLNKTKKHKYSDDEDDENQGIKIDNKKPVVVPGSFKKPIIPPIANYFDNPNDQQTPLNTPNNKKLEGGGFNFNMDKMDFSKNKNKYSGNEDDDDENRVKKIENNNTNKTGGGLNFDINKMDFSNKIKQHKYSDDEDDENQVKKNDNKKPIIPIANYFDNPNDNKTPLNTPNNKRLGGGGFNFNMSNMDFSKNKHKYSDDEDNDEVPSKQDM